MHYVYLGVALAWGTALARTDFAVHRLPDLLVLPAYPVVLTLIASEQGSQVGFATGTSLAFLAAGWLAHQFADLGLGDVKLLGVVGLMAGATGTVPDSLAVASVMGGIHATIHLASGGKANDHIPFGPAILCGITPALVNLV